MRKEQVKRKPPKKMTKAESVTFAERQHAAIIKDYRKDADQLSGRKDAFIKQLAIFLVGEQGAKSIALEVSIGRPHVLNWAQHWADLRAASPLFGYPTVEEAEDLLREFLR